MKSFRGLKHAMLAAACLCVPGATLGAPAPGESFDIILKHGMVYDGAGTPGFVADVGVRDGKIVAVGDLKNAAAKTTLDVSGLAVAPGFINIHDHPVPSALVHSANMLMQGVTTEIFNPDGGGVPGTNPIDLASDLDVMSASGLGTNIGGYIGFNAVWESVIGKTDRAASPGEIQKMRDLVTKNLRAGAFGVSAGLDYKPGYYATTAEVIDVASAARDWRTNFPNHERLTPETNYSSRVGIAETIAIGEGAGLSPEITHMKAQGLEQGRSIEILAMMSAATARGHYTPSDLYPYIAGQSGLDALMVPGWALEGGRDGMLKRFADPDTRAKIVIAVEQAMKARFGGPEGVYLPDTKQQLTQIMKDMNVGAGEAVIRTLEKAPRGAILTFGSDADVINFMKYPATAIACDCGSNDNGLHPRYNGTFTKVLGHYVRETHVLTLTDAVRKMSGLPASIIGIVDRGLIAPGMAADITVFDPATVIDHSTFSEPALRSTGIRDVLVNGVLAVRDGDLTGNQGGTTLRRTEHMPTRQMFDASRAVSASGTLAGSGTAMTVTLRLTQPAATHAGTGNLRISDTAGHAVLELTKTGFLQVANNWASITGMARLPGGGLEAVTVIVDKGDPLAGVGTASLSVDGVHTHLAGTMPSDNVSISGGL